MKHTLKHKLAIIMVALQNPKVLSLALIVRLITHDLDKLILGRKRTKPTHRPNSRHHIEWQVKHLGEVTETDVLEALLDWECARYTKPDKPLNARETLNQIYGDIPKELKKKYQKLLDKLF